ncbi:sulfite exporter TauE/SafE family protein [Novosphingobium album (ex Hu et al. 2023)]|uniref:Probable membrane transporter protein n=1 Tax=Novosphingobium album (ex Hu et al. 2023) TaxID=2930093 RepID=A0ABT0B5G9_9SPHN|nr:sulfite exporter TauE/SafE family protein [Novosphingobium album (ex Hu et al. 2023)]MCJ2180327.1 sulfite exporter TauE/SafE family protein [Novosphingobium album (ex Hu et al. 2023)]
MIQHLDLLHALAGLLVGMLVGLTGVGGGSLMTPLLVLLFGVSPQTAVGTDLLYAAITKITGSAVHGWRATVDWQIVRRLASGSIPAALLTLALLAQFGRIGQHGEKVILLTLAVMLALTALITLMRRRLAGFAHGLEPLDPPAKVIGGTVVLGAAIGIAVTVSSVGAGAIGVTALLLLYPRLRMVKIVGSDIAHAVPLALIAGTGHWLIGDVDGLLLTNLLIGSIPGVILGSLLSVRASDKLLQPLLAVVLALSSWQLFVKALTSDKLNAAHHHVSTSPDIRNSPKR